MGESQGSSKSEDSPEEKQQQQQQSCINAAAIEHCTDLELEPPYATTLRTKEDKMNFLKYIGRFVVLEDDNLDPLRTKPFAEKKMRRCYKKNYLVARWICCCCCCCC